MDVDHENGATEFKPGARLLVMYGLGSYGATEFKPGVQLYIARCMPVSELCVPYFVCACCVMFQAGSIMQLHVACSHAWDL